MSDRKKKGLASIISGAVFLAAGIVLFQTSVTPDWFNTTLSLVGLIANFFGLGVTMPEEQ